MDIFIGVSVRVLKLRKRHELVIQGSFTHKRKTLGRLFSSDQVASWFGVR